MTIFLSNTTTVIHECTLVLIEKRTKDKATCLRDRKYLDLFSLVAFFFCFGLNKHLHISAMQPSAFHLHPFPIPST